MSFLEDQLKQLQTKKEKVAYFQAVIKFLENLAVPPEENEPSVTARKEVIIDVTDFIDAQIKAIEDGKPQTPAEKDEGMGIWAGNQFTQDEINILKQMIASVNNKLRNQNNGAFVNEGSAPQTPPSKPETAGQKAKRQDMLQFALANRHLEKKRVTVVTKDGNVGGIVVGMLAPNIIVKTDTGHEVPVDLDNLIVEN